MDAQAILAPVVTLVLWSLVMWAWLYATRIPAMQKLKIPLDPTKPTGELTAALPPQVRWKADNYNHLMEQPTIFYAIVFALILMGGSLPINVYLAWGYVILRILHSLVQGTTNVVRIRLSLFLLSSLCLLGLTVHALAWVVRAAL